MRKKILAGLMAAVAVMAILSLFAGCGGGGSTSTSSTDTTVSTSLLVTTTPPPIVYPSGVVITGLAQPQVTRVDINQLADMINKHQDFILVDTRDAATYALGHIIGAVDVPSYPPGAPYQALLEKLPTDKMIVFYCK